MIPAWELPPGGICSIGPKEMAAAAIGALWLPSVEELAERARWHLANFFGAADAASVEQEMGQPAERA